MFPDLAHGLAAGKQETRFSMETFNESTARLRDHHVSKSCNSSNMLRMLCVSMGAFVTRVWVTCGRTLQTLSHGDTDGRFFFEVQQPERVRRNFLVVVTALWMFGAELYSWYRVQFAW